MRENDSNHSGKLTVSKVAHLPQAAPRTKPSTRAADEKVADILKCYEHGKEHLAAFKERLRLCA